MFKPLRTVIPKKKFLPGRDVFCGLEMFYVDVYAMYVMYIMYYVLCIMYYWYVYYLLSISQDCTTHRPLLRSREAQSPGDGRYLAKFRVTGQ